MPGHLDPRINLSLVMEQGGRNDDAKAAYESALEVWPEYMPAMQGLAMMVVRMGAAEPRLHGWTKTSLHLFVSPPTRLVASLSKAT